MLVKIAPHNYATKDSRYLVTKTRNGKGYTLIDTTAPYATPERFPFGGNKSLSEIKTFIVSR